LEALGSIDEDLEGSLALWEKAPDAPDAAAIAALHARALWGAARASEALGTPLFADYASAFVGWGAEEKRSFRAGQQAHGRARKALRGGDFQAAAEQARSCAELALPLGDWWGFAMGKAAEGLALAGAGRDIPAAAALSQARSVYAALRLAGAERECVAALVSVLERTKQPERARNAARDALSLTRALGDSKGLAQALEALARCEEACGDADAAARLRAESRSAAK
jgi:tetratricopeptide (TPR) repeat protein